MGVVYRKLLMRSSKAQKCNDRFGFKIKKYGTLDKLSLKRFPH